MRILSVYTPTLNGEAGRLSVVFSLRFIYCDSPLSAFPCTSESALLEGEGPPRTSDPRNETGLQSGLLVSYVSRQVSSQETGGVCPHLRFISSAASDVVSEVEPKL